VRPSGATSSEIHVPSVAVNRSERVAMSGSVLLFTAALAALSFCAGVCAKACPAIRDASASEAARRTMTIMFEWERESRASIGADRLAPT
jgi:hypothetical protein